MRLKGLIRDVAKSGTIKFQFQTGAIKSEAVDSLTVIEQHFNSKLVRLKVKNENVKEFAEFLFQFQTGAIKSNAQNKPLYFAD